MDSFRQYLDAHILTLCEAELPFLLSALELDVQEDHQAFDTMVAHWQALNPVNVIRRCSKTLGENWFKLVQRTYAPPQLRPLERWFSENERPMYFIIIFPKLMHALKFERDAIQQLFFHMAVRDQTNAAVRLGLFGPATAQELYVVGVTAAQRMASEHATLRFEQAYRSQPMIDMAQGSHQNLYSKLFQN